jgi:hypothetical protein
MASSVALAFLYKNVAGVDAHLRVLVYDNWTYQAVDDDGACWYEGGYKGGHDHGAGPPDSVFYLGPSPQTHSDDAVWFILREFTQIMVSLGELKAGRWPGKGKFKMQPKYLVMKPGQEFTWVVLPSILDPIPNGMK